MTQLIFEAFYSPPPPPKKKKHPQVITAILGTVIYCLTSVTFIILSTVSKLQITVEHSKRWNTIWKIARNILLQHHFEILTNTFEITAWLKYLISSKIMLSQHLVADPWNFWVKNIFLENGRTCWRHNGRMEDHHCKSGQRLEAQQFVDRHFIDRISFTLWVLLIL